MEEKQRKIVKFNGGLGNQMFQYAFALALKEKFNTEIVFDYSYFEEVKKCENVTSRVFELGIFNVDCKQVNEKELANVRKPEFKSKLKQTIAKIFPQKFKINYIRGKNPYEFQKKFFSNPDYIFYDGYFQNEKYFKHLRETLLKDFSIKETLDEKNQEALNNIQTTNSVSIHIRRGDYVSLDYVNKIHGTCSLEYYRKAIDLIAKKIKDPHFYLFSDDIDWVIENLKIQYPYTVVDFNQSKGYLDMELMRNCKHNIIANSSFSWWAAWLNNNPQKIVIAPKNWTTKKQKCDITPKSWIKL